MSSTQQRNRPQQVTLILFAGPKEWILSRGGPNTMNGAGQTEIPEFTL